MDKDHFLTPGKLRTSIDANSTSFDEILKMFHDSRENGDEIMRLAKAKDIGYTFTFASSKVRSFE